MLRVGLTGGIGSGKSTLAAHFRAGGVPYYDSDLRARELMTMDGSLRAEIIALLGSKAYLHEGGDGSGSSSSSSSWVLNRRYVADQIFADPSKRDALNGLVHPAVMRDFDAWVASQASDVPYVIFESALLFDAGLDGHFDKTLAVLAPVGLRLQRVVDRDGCSISSAEARIAAQLSDDELHRRAHYSVVNIVEDELEGAARRLDQLFKYEALQRVEGSLSQSVNIKKDE